MQDSPDLLAFILPPVTDSVGDFIDVQPMQPGTPVVDGSTRLGGQPHNPSALGGSVAPGASDGGSESETRVVLDGEQFRGTRSTNGRDSYDPSVHLFPPEETATGRWRKIPGRKRDETRARLAADGIGALDEMPNAAYRKEAQKYAELYGNSHSLFFGTDGRIESRDELTPMIDAIEGYLSEHGYSSMPAGWSVALTCASYTVGVCTRESNAEKVKRFFAPFIDTVYGWFHGGKKKAVAKTEKATSDNPQQQSSRTSRYGQAE